ncbi:hemin ABC transporter substrate-binding protein [Sphingobacterium sp. KB22]|uniref:Hemin ABC transporter substrate-binding protein n=2 Tax=Sphingobacterium hungaricum TaxID=2082723 RepID=A0A928UYK3_9SPHI|nr:hemin ABC transporter substrate-binding protein [Sphingobacterium hungaricum]
MIALTNSCNQSAKKTEDATLDSARIVSINGTITEILADLGLEEKIVGVDVASTYPASIQTKPKIGHNKNISAEGVLALNPTLIIGTKADLKPETLEQFKQAGIQVLLFEQAYSVEGTKNLIKSVSDSVGLPSKGDSILVSLNSQLEKVASYASQTPKPKVLFIYARGTGTMMVGGTGTQVDAMISLAGGENVAKDIQDYKPLTAEALVAYNPDVLLLFDSGLSSLGNAEGLLEVQGVKETNAGKNKKIVQMDGQFLTGFSPRLAQAIEELHKKIH